MPNENNLQAASKEIKNIEPVPLSGLTWKGSDPRIKDTKRWVYINLAPGQYKVSVSATVSGKQVKTAATLLVKAQEVTRSEVSLPVGRGSD